MTGAWQRGGERQKKREEMQGRVKGANGREVKVSVSGGSARKKLQREEK